MEPAPSSLQRSDHEERLWASLKGEGASTARGELFGLYTPLARRIARRHFLDSREGVEFADLCQMAYAGLLEAMDRFEAGRGVSFAHYAERRIAGSVLDGLGHLSERREQTAFRARMRRERAKSLAGEGVVELTGGEALDRLAEAAVGLAIGFMLDDSSLFQHDGAVDRQPSAYDSLRWKEMLKRVAAEVVSLPDREALIIRHHYLDSVDFDHIARLLAISKGRVSQLHRAALLRLKSRLNSAGQLSLDQ